MNVPLLGAAVIALVCVLLLVRHDHPAPASHPDDLTIGLRSMRELWQRLTSRPDDALLGEPLIDALGALPGATRPRITAPQRPGDRPIVAIRFRQS